MFLTKWWSLKLDSSINFLFYLLLNKKKPGKSKEKVFEKDISLLLLLLIYNSRNIIFI